MSPLQMQTMMPDIKEMFVNIRPYLDTHIGDIYGIEQPLFSDRLKIAGRCDCIGMWDGVLSIIDWKTSSRLKDKNHIENYFMQATAYSEMFEERTSMPIEQLVIAIAVEGETLPQIFIEKIFESHVDWMELINNDDNYKNILQVKIQKEFKTTPDYIELSHTENGYEMGVFLCLGKQIYDFKPEEATNYTELNSFQKIQERLLEKGFVFIFLTKSIHKIKKKAEQAACQEAINLIS